MAGLAALLQVGAATALMAAAAAKLAAPGPVGATVTALGLRPAGLWLGLLVGVEGATATALATAPTAAATTLAVIGLGALFAGVGLRTHLRGEQISCACFGAQGHPLGLRQVAWLPAWVAAAVVPRWSSHLGGGDGLLALAAGVVAVGAVAAVPVARLATAGLREARVEAAAP